MKTKNLILIFLLLILSGCSTISRNTTMEGMKNLPKEQQEMTLEQLVQLPEYRDRLVTICRGDIIKVGQDCAELMKMPRWVHPLIFTYIGCTNNWYVWGEPDENGEKYLEIQRSVMYLPNGIDWPAYHEIYHTIGLGDKHDNKVELDPEKVKKGIDLANKIENSYGEKCKTMTLWEFFQVLD